MKNNKKIINMILALVCIVILNACSSTGNKGGSYGSGSEKISTYFTMAEATHSDTAIKRGINNYPKNPIHKKNILYTAKRMDQIRRFLNRPITVTSWYRSPNVNKYVGGSKSSAHMDGLAVDFYLKKGSAKREFNRLKNSSLKFDQLIFYPKGNRAHVGFRRNGKNERRQIIVYKNKR